MMKNPLFRKYWYLTVVAVLFFASASFAQTTQVSLTGVDNQALVGNVYVDPYFATIGTASNTVPVICDDWSDNSYVPETWTANVSTIPVASGNSTPLFAPLANSLSSGTTATQLYSEVAWLSTQLLAAYSQNQTTAQAEYSFAIWELTYPFAPTPESTTPGAFLLANAPGDVSAVATDIANATTAVVKNGYTGSGWEILTPASTPTCGGAACPSSPPQEFLVYTPESSATILFGADMFGLLGLVIVFRRRLLRPIL